MMTQAEFRAAFREEIGDLTDLASDGEIDRWVNEGRTRIGIYDRKTATLAFSTGATEVDLPADLVQLAKLHGPDVYLLGNFRQWGLKLTLLDEDGATGDGSVTLFYLAYFPEIDAVQASTMPAEADRGCLSYSLYRFFKKLASSRSNYRRYATLVGANAVQIDDLQAEADRHYSDFTESLQALPPEPPAFFFGG